MLSIPSLNLKVNLRKFNGKIANGKKTVNTYITANGVCDAAAYEKQRLLGVISAINMDWNYEQNGRDWYKLFPDCASDHQSPINFEKPITTYGISYD